MLEVGCAIVPATEPEVTTTVKGALPPLIVPLMIASGDPEQSKVLVTAALAVNRCASVTAVPVENQPFLSLTNTVYDPGATLIVLAAWNAPVVPEIPYVYGPKSPDTGSTVIVNPLPEAVH